MMNKVLVIGDIMIDHYITGVSNRISPEAPVPVVEVNNETYTLGGAGNVLKNLKAFGLDVDILGITGNDSLRTYVVNEITSLGCNPNSIFTVDGRPTTIKSRVLAGHHQLVRLDKEISSPIDSVTEKRILNWLEHHLEQYSLILLSDYNKGLLTQALLDRLFKLAKLKNIRTILDPKVKDFSRYKGVSIIKPNKKEAELATGMLITNEESLEKVCKEIKSLVGCEELIITLSEDGMACYSSDNCLSIIPTKVLEVIDVTGAGDTVLAALGYSFLNGSKLVDACEFANKAASLVVRKLGSATTNLREIEEYLAPSVKK